MEHCRLIRQEVGPYGADGLVDEDDLLTEGKAHAMFMLETLGSGSTDIAPAQQVGRKRAQQGVPLAAVMSAYRVGIRYWWEQIGRKTQELALPSESLLIAGSELWQHQAEYTEALAAAYQEVATERSIERQHARSALVAGLLEGSLPVGISTWDAARMLKLPEAGNYVVVAIGLDTIDPGIAKTEAALEAIGFPSAWRLEADAQVGLVALSAAARLTRLQEILKHNSAHRIGISPLYDGIPPTGEGLRYARIALLAATDADQIVVFDHNPYAIAAVSDPQTMARYAQTVLGALNDLSTPDKTVLLETFRQWITAGGTVAETAELLFCHPNTVRYRLRRLKELTGRDIARPSDVAELWLAVEADTRLHSD
ncbi:hypothetical protein AFM11_32200 [Mycolicibacterium wolinskyi]|uniref:PucR family transcriptional regulator n=2 Tax=Mycolicibacterium wolinskyi TaxID=59750 RepID=A0A132PD03_9MYCO|nr:hypothetical protein AFM11_32200 [Mycolicibacterium wolinskyi]